MSKFTKEEFIAKFALYLNVTKAEAGRRYEQFLGFTEDVLAEAVPGEDITLVPLGCLKLVEKPARVGRSPKDGTPINIPKKVHVRFAPSQRLKKLIQVEE